MIILMTFVQEHVSGFSGAPVMGALRIPIAAHFVTYCNHWFRYAVLDIHYMGLNIWGGLGGDFKWDM